MRRATVIGLVDLTPQQTVPDPLVRGTGGQDSQSQRARAPQAGHPPCLPLPLVARSSSLTLGSGSICSRGRPLCERAALDPPLPGPGLTHAREARGWMAPEPRSPAVGSAGTASTAHATQQHHHHPLAHLHLAPEHQPGPWTHTTHLRPPVHQVTPSSTHHHHVNRGLDLPHSVSLADPPTSSSSASSSSALSEHHHHQPSSWSDPLRHPVAFPAMHPPQHHPTASAAAATQYPSPSQAPLRLDTGRTHWQDDARRKSLKLSHGNDDAGAMSLPLSQWQWPGADGGGDGGGARRESAGEHHGGGGGGGPSLPHLQVPQGHDVSASSMLPSPVGTSTLNPTAWPPPASHLSHFYPSLPNPFATPGGGGVPPPGSSDGARPGSSSAAAVSAASAYPTPYAAYSGLPPQTGTGLPPTYLPYGVSSGGGGAPAYLPYTPTSASFSPHHAYAPVFSHSMSPGAAAAFAPTASSSSQLQQHQQPHPLAPPPSLSAYSQPPYASYLPSPSSHLSQPPPLPPPAPPPQASTVPPQATLGYTGGVVGAASMGDSPTSPTFPTDASTPYIPPDPSAPTHPCVLVAAANRDQIGAIDLTGHSRPDDGNTRRASTAQSSRRAIDLVYDCQNCRRRIGRLTLRGGAVDKSVGDSPAKYMGVFYCSQCVAPPPGSAHGGGTRADGLSGGSMAYASEATYYDTLTAAVDRFQGIDPTLGDTRPPPAPPGKVRSGFTASSLLGGGVMQGGGGGGGGKKRRVSVAEESEGVLGCDVCRRDLATGTLQLVATGEPVGATIEVLCAHCESRYTRCSDCGGGGGSKGCVLPFPHSPSP